MQNLQETGWDTVCLKVSKLPRLQRTELPVLQLVSPSNRPIQISNLSKNGFPKVVQKRVRLNVDTSPEATKLAVPSRSCREATDIGKRRSTVRKHFFVNAAAASISQSVKLSGKSPKSERTKNEERRIISFWAIPAPSQSCTGAFSTQ